MLMFVWAEDKAHNIGYQGHLPWHLPDDLAYFKKVTMGHPMIMGKTTFASFPKLLPGRLHVVLTHQKDLGVESDQLILVHNFAELQAWIKAHQDQEIAVIGGAGLFELLKDQVEILHKTEIQGVFPADTKMVALDYDQFEEISRTPGVVDAKNQYAHDFVVYQRRQEVYE